MDCPSCGAFNSQLSEICSKCGAGLDAAIAKARRRTKKKDGPPREAPSVAIPSTFVTPRRTTLLFIVTAFSAIETLLSSVAEVTLSDRLTKAGFGTLHTSLFGPLAPFSLVRTLMSFAVIVISLGWISGAWRDLRAMFPTRKLKYSAISAVLWYFVPLINFVHVFLVYFRLREATEAEGLPAVPARAEQPVTDYRVAPDTVDVRDRFPAVNLRAWLISWGIAGFALLAGVVAESYVLLSVVPIAVLFYYLYWTRMILAFEARLVELRRRIIYSVSQQIEPVATHPHRLWWSSLAALAAASIHAVGIAIFAHAGPADTTQWHDSALVLVVFLLAIAATLKAPLRVRTAVALSGVVALGGSWGRVVYSLNARIADSMVGAAEAKRVFDVAILDLNNGADDARVSAEALDEIGRKAVAELERIGRAHPNDSAAEYRCVVERIRRIDVAIHESMALWSHLPEGRFEARRKADPSTLREHALYFERAVAASEGETTSRGSESTERDLACLRSSGLPPARVEVYRKSWQTDSSGPVDPRESAGRAYAAAVVARDHALEAIGPYEVKNARIVFATPPPSSWEANEVAMMAAKRVWMASTPESRQKYQVIRESRDLDIATYVSKFPGLPPVETSIPAPPGMSWTQYNGPLGKMRALVTTTPKRAGQQSALLWAPNYWVGNDLAMASALAREGWIVMLPMLRGMSDNPGRIDLNLGEIDDLRAAWVALKARPDVDSRRLLITGDNLGATRAVMLAETTGGHRGVMARGPLLAQDWVTSLTTELDRTALEKRSPLRYLQGISTPVFLFHGIDSVLLGDLAVDLQPAGSRFVHSIGCTSDACSDERWVSLIRSKLDEPGELAFRKEAPDNILHLVRVAPAE